MTKGFVLNTINLWKNPSTALWNLCTLGQKLKTITEDGLLVYVVRCQKGSTDNLHNHPLHGATKIAGYNKV